MYNISYGPGLKLTFLKCFDLPKRYHRKMDYREKDVVWVKISHYPWWPAQVFNVEYEDGIQTKVTVNFFNEEYINPITKQSRIKPFMCKEKDKYFAAGLKEGKSLDLFKQAYGIASKLCYTECLSDKNLGKPESSNTYTSDHHSRFLNGEKSSSCDNSLGGHSPSPFHYHAYKSARLKYQINWNDQVGSPHSSNSLIQSNDSSKPSGNLNGVLKGDNDSESRENYENLKKKRKLTFEDEFAKKIKQNQDNVTRDEQYSLELPVLSKTSTPKRAIKKSSSNINIIKTFTKLSQRKENLKDYCKHNRETKEKNELKTNMISDSENARTPKSKTSNWEESFELPTPSLNHFPGLTFDSNLDKDECDSCSDSDTELPEGLSPIALTRGEQPIHEKDIVWLRVRKLPAWPAFVRKIYKKKKRIHKLSVVFIEACKQLPKRYRVTYTPKTMVPFIDKQKQKFVEEGDAIIDPDMKKKFKEACEKAESFLHQKALLTLNKAEFSFFNFINSDDEEEVGSDFSEVIPPVAPDSTTMSDVEERLSDAEIDEASNTSDQVFYNSLEPSAKEIRRKMKMTAKQENLVNFTKTNEMKKYLFDIFYEKKKSDRHRKYFYGSVKEQNSLKFAGFGPIYSEEQEEEIVEATKDWLFEIPSSKRPSITYILDVWIPEAIVYAMIRIKKYNRKKAWEQFWKGTRTTKEERDRQHQSLLDFRGYTEEEKAEMKQKSEERLKTKLYQLGIRS